jgi:hypothetical protein
MYCIARAFRDEPLRRLVVGSAHRVIFVLNPDLPQAAGGSEEAGVGFPVDAVYEFDEGLFTKLRDAYDRGDRAELWVAWEQATRLRPATLRALERA